MKIDAILSELEQAAKHVGVRVSYENIGGELGAGGLCKVKGEWRVIVDRRATPGERVSLLAQALLRFPLAGAKLSPATLELLEKTRGMGRPPSGQPPAGAPAPGQPPAGPATPPHRSR